MKICEGCVKQDVCKFKDEVGKYEVKRVKVLGIPKPLVPDLSCKYKKTEPCRTVSCPSVWTAGTTYAPDNITYTSDSASVPYWASISPCSTGTITVGGNAD